MPKYLIQNHKICKSHKLSTFNTSVGQIVFDEDHVAEVDEAQREWLMGFDGSEDLSVAGTPKAEAEVELFPEVSNAEVEGELADQDDDQTEDELPEDGPGETVSVGEIVDVNTSALKSADADKADSGNEKAATKVGKK